MMEDMDITTCYCCDSPDRWTALRYTAPPVGETQFTFSNQAYRRQVVCCAHCGHFMSLHAMDDKALYSQDYVTATYGKSGFRETFERIINLPMESSDNVRRCIRINAFAEKLFDNKDRGGRSPTILDVGSGLCVFLYGMKKFGWQGTALDPDERAAKHAREVVKVGSICGDFFQCDPQGTYDAIALNKVLEHVYDPVVMLSRCLSFLSEGGFVYVEVPDGEAAIHEGANREEFFVEHHHVFSFASLAMISSRAGFRVVQLGRLREPSGKFTLYAFLQAPAVARTQAFGKAS